ALVSAAAYHFGSYRGAIEAAGIDDADVTRRPRWTKQGIIKLIKDGKRKGLDLHWSAVTQRRDELGRAAFASLQPRLFGRWDRALTGAGLDADEISRYRRWDKTTVAFELRARFQDDEALNSGAIQREDSGLHAAAVRHFGSYDEALRAAKVDPADVRRRRHWTRPEVVAALKTAAKAGSHLSDSTLRKENAALYGASVRLFGSFTAARDAAKVTWKRKRQAPRRR
ncbi:MAG: hypothetical protein ABIP55_03680, partial [Tepidisphaeraceae bacterium]